MKKKALLVLLPALAMALAGCSGTSSADDDEETSEQGGGGTLPEGVTEADFGTLSAPVTIAQAKALLDKLDPNKGGDTFAGYRLYVKGIVSANAAYDSSYGNYGYAYIADETAEDFSINKFILASGVSGDWTAKNSMKGKQVVASGYACIYTDKSGNQKYEITSLHDAEKDDDKAQVHSIAEPPMPTDVNYGTLENPLSVSQAIAEINKFPAKTTDQPLYVTGTVKSNTEYSTQYSNLDIVITDGQNDFTLFRVTAIPGMTIADVGEDGLVGATVIAHAISTYYSQASKYETNANPTLDVFSLPASDIEFSTHSINLNTESPAEDLDLSQYVNFLPAGAQPVEVVYAIVTEDSPVTINSETGVLDLTQVESDGSVLVSVTIKGTAKTDSMTVNYTVPQAGQITSFALSSEAEEFFFNGSEEQKRADINITNVLPQEHEEEFAVAEVKNTGTEQAPVWSAVAPEEAKVDVELNGAQDGLTVALKGSVEAVGSTLVRVYPADHIENGKNIVITISEFVDYGTFDDPLSISEVIALIEAGKASGHEIYVTGTIDSASYNTSKSDYTLWINDGEGHRFEFYGATLAAGLGDYSEHPEELVGAVIVGHASTAQKYTPQAGDPIYEFNKNCVVDSIGFPQISELSWKNEGVFDVGAGDTLDLSEKVVKTGFGDVTFELVEDSLPEGVTFDTTNGVLVIPSVVEDSIIHVIAKAGEVTSDPCTINISSAAIVIDYGTQESPLSVSEALALVNAHVGSGEQTAEKVYMRGVVKSNGSWSSQYSNFNNGTVLTDLDDSSVEITAWQVGTDVTEYQTGAENCLVGYKVTVWGIIENGSHGIQFVGKGASKLMDFEAPAISALAFGADSYSKTVNGTDEATFDAASKLNITGKTGTLVWSVTDPTDPADDKVKVLDASVGTVTIYSDVTDRTVTIRVELDEDPTIFAECDLVITVDEGGGGGSLIEQVAYTLDGTQTGGTNGYATVSDIEQNGISWGVTANTTMNPWRFGGKNLSGELRTAASKSAVSEENITKVVVNTGTATITVDSVKLYVGTAEGLKDVSELSLAFVASSALTFERPESADWSNRYFTIVFEVTETSGSNKYVQLSSVEFYAMLPEA